MTAPADLKQAIDSLLTMDVTDDGERVWFGGANGALGYYDLETRTRADFSEPVGVGNAFHAIAVAGAEVGVLFCAIVLSTGPLWARKAWGVWWTWDPRLTSVLLAGMVFVSYLALRSFGHAGESEKRFAAALALLWRVRK